MNRQMFESSELAARTRYWALAMTRIPSVTGSRDEAAFPARLGELIAAEPAFAAGHVSVRIIPVDGDALGRSCVALLVRGKGARTVVLTGHFDTVGIDDYAELRDVAIEPDRLHDRLLVRLRRATHTAAERLALQDLECGDYLPGRGLLDMKAGLAAGLALAEGFAQTDTRNGNILVLAVPDEEANSAGARQAARSLPALARELGLELCAAINMDSIADDGDGRAGRMVALGSVGKLLASALVIGRPAHACYPLAGINAGAIAGALAAELEWSHELSDARPGVPGVPPTLLSLKDSKAHYDVTTPARVFASWNVLTYGRSAESILAGFAAVTGRACAAIAGRLAATAARHGGAAGPVAIRVLTVAELRDLARQRDPQIDGQVTRVLAAHTGPPLSIPDQCRLAMEALWQATGLAGPAVVIGFGSMPYLPVSLGDGGNARLLAAAVEAACAEAGGRHGCSIGTTGFFPGISDVSFLGEADLAGIPVIAANTAAWREAVGWPAEGGVAGIPTINAGPWGRDYHTPLERLHVGYGFQALPQLVGAITARVLQG